MGIIATACTRDAPSADATAGGTPNGATSSTPSDARVVLAVASPATRLAAANRISGPVGVQGVGPLHPGMSLARAVVVMQGDFWTRDSSLSCSYFRAARAPGMKFLFLNRYLARIEVDSGDMATIEGAKIGNTEDEVRALYPGQVVLARDAYTTGHYLTVTPSAAADSARRIVFETHDQRVTRFRAGLRPAIEWVEGCS